MIVEVFLVKFWQRGRFLKPDSSNSKYFYCGKDFTEYAERFWPFSLGPLPNKLYMYTFHLKNSKMKNFKKTYRNFVKSNIILLRSDNMKAQH